MLLWNQGRTIAKTVDQEKIQGLPLLRPIRLHCCTNYNAPTGALDSKSGKEVLKLFRKLNDMGNTIVMITHDLEVAKAAKSVVKIVDGEMFAVEN